MKRAQIAVYVVLGLVIFLVFLGLINLIVQLIPTQKVMSAQDVNQFTTNCLELSLTCSLYTQGLIPHHQTLDDIHQQTTDYTKNAFTLCLGDLSKKFRGNTFKLDDSTPKITFNDDTTTAQLQKLGTMKTGTTQKSLENYAAQQQIALTRIYTLIQTLKNTAREKPITTIDPRFTLNIYQIDDAKETIIITDAQSKLNEKPYKAIFTT